MAQLEVSLADGEYYFSIDPCPFCGKDLGEFVDSTQYIWVECSNNQCRAQGPSVFSFKEAAEKWNSRE